MNITQETESLFKEKNNKSDFIKYMDRQFDNADWGNLKDKLKTTPDRRIKRISKIFRVDWSRVFKRGWLLWK